MRFSTKLAFEPVLSKAVEGDEPDESALQVLAACVVSRKEHSHGALCSMFLTRSTVHAAEPRQVCCSKTVFPLLLTWLERHMGNVTILTSICEILFFCASERR